MTKPDNDAIAASDIEDLRSALGEAVEVVSGDGPAPDSAYYSPSTGGFYHDQVHGAAMPEDVIEIGHDVHRALMDAQGAGKMIMPGKDGAPVAVDRSGPTPEQRAAQTARFRDIVLRDTAWRIAEDEPDRKAWIAYRAKVRAINLAEPVWPDAPA